MKHMPSRPADDLSLRTVRRPRPTPFLLCRSDPGGEPAPRRPAPFRLRRILAAVDFSPESERARRLAESVAASTDALLDLLCVVDAFTEIFCNDNRDLAENPDRFLSSTGIALEVLVRHARSQGIRCVGTLLVGAPALELARHAGRTGADLLVLTLPRMVQVLRGRQWRAMEPRLMAALVARPEAYRGER
jgi:nucleotide-binding universal stress UspA family protein